MERAWYGTSLVWNELGMERAWYGTSLVWKELGMERGWLEELGMEELGM